MGNKVEAIVIHCSDSAWGTAFEIDRWHKARGWKGIGYLGVIGNGFPVSGMDKPWSFADGAWEWGRPLDDNEWLDPFEIEAQVRGWNKKTIGYCLIGKPEGGDYSKFTDAQLYTAREIAYDLCDHFDLGFDDVLGHYELDSGKVCPGMDMDQFRAFMLGDIEVGEVLKKN